MGTPEASGGSGWKGQRSWIPVAIMTLFSAPGVCDGMSSLAPEVCWQRLYAEGTGDLCRLGQSPFQGIHLTHSEYLLCVRKRGLTETQAGT